MLVFSRTWMMLNHPRNGRKAVRLYICVVFDFNAFFSPFVSDAQEIEDVRAFQVPQCPPLFVFTNM